MPTSDRHHIAFRPRGTNISSPTNSRGRRWPTSVRGYDRRCCRGDRRARCVSDRSRSARRRQDGVRTGAQSTGASDPVRGPNGVMIAMRFPPKSMRYVCCATRARLPKSWRRLTCAAHSRRHDISKWTRSTFRQSTLPGLPNPRAPGAHRLPPCRCAMPWRRYWCCNPRAAALGRRGAEGT